MAADTANNSLVDAMLLATKRWRDDPNQFVLDCFGVAPRDWQAEAMMAVNANRRVTIRSGHGIGKSTLVSWLVLWWHITRFPAKTLITGSGFDQLKATMWAEMQMWARKLPAPLQDQFDITAEQLSLKAAPESSFAALRTASPDRTEGLAGFHSPYSLIIADEASGINDKVFEVLSGAMTEAGAKLVLTGNPTRNSGYFYNSFHALRDSFYAMHVSCTTCPWISDDWLKEQEITYGKDSNAWRIRVEGEFPLAEDDTLIPLEWVEAAQYRVIDVPVTIPVVWGVDVGGPGGDATAVCKRRGNVLIEPIEHWNDADPAQTAARIISRYNMCPNYDRPKLICVDEIGIGAGVVAILRQEGLPVRGVNVAEAAAMNTRFARKRDELWWRLREWFRDRSCKIPRQEALVSELVGPRYAELTSGKVKVESKDEMKRRGLKSPNLADSLMLTMEFTPEQLARAGRTGSMSGQFQAQTSFRMW